MLNILFRKIFLSFIYYAVGLSSRHAGKIIIKIQGYAEAFYRQDFFGCYKWGEGCYGCVLSSNSD